MSSNLHDYDYPLPKEQIAQQPLPCRTDARLMVVDRRVGQIEHAHVRDLPDWLGPGDRLVLNDTRVVPARLVGYRTKTDGRWQGLFLNHDTRGFWRLLAKTRGKVAVGETITLVDRTAHDDVRLVMISRMPDGVWVARLESSEDAHEVLDRVGRVPLPHYIRGGQMLDADREAYQTVFARRPGSVAAPTAGLHFTQELLRDLEERNIGIDWVTLHVGLDTFRPISTLAIDQHPMHREWAELSREAAESLRSCRSRSRGGRIVAVGTTVVRVLETAARGGAIEPWQGETDLFIHPPYTFRAVDAMLTNFHLPRTTLLVLVRTFGGDELLQRAYEEAMREGYRFYSYGDAMLIL